MAKIIMLCGRICSGKSTYAKKLRDELKGVILSLDELTLSLGDDLGEMHEVYCERLEKYLFRKSEEIFRTGINVIIDTGLWTRKERDEAREYWQDKSVPAEIHFISVSDEEWERRIAKRNSLISSGEKGNYYVDEGLKAKALTFWEKPDDDEEGVIVIKG